MSELKIKSISEEATSPNIPVEKGPNLATQQSENTSQNFQQEANTPKRRMKKNLQSEPLWHDPYAAAVVFVILKQSEAGAKLAITPMTDTCAVSDSGFTKACRATSCCQNLNLPMMEV